MSPANSFSLNSYFYKKRARAMGLAVTISGIGTVLMPLTVSFLLQHFSPEQTMFIVSGLVLNCLPASLLLQPVYWHMRPIPLSLLPPNETETVPKRKRTVTVTSIDVGHSLFTVADAEHHTPRQRIARSVSQQQRCPNKIFL